MESTLYILHLEDNANDAELIHSILEANGLNCQIVLVDNREDFQTALDESNFDLILADYTLPSFDGISALQITQQKKPDIPFIFISGKLGEEVAIETLKNGATDYVLKNRLNRLVPALVRALQEANDRRERKKAEEELRKKTEYLEAIMNSSLDLIFTIDKDGKLRYMNNKLEDILGYNITEIAGKSFFDFLPDDQIEYIKEIWYQLRDGKSAVFEAKVKHEKGITADCLISSSPLPGVEEFLVFLKDITKSRQVEKALRESENKFKMVFDHASDAIIIHDLSGSILEFNTVAYNRLGYSREDFASLSLFDIVPSRQKKLLLEKTEEVRQKGQNVYETYHMTKSGSLVPVEVSNRLIGFFEKMAILEIVRDISERKEAEQALKESEERYRSFFDDDLTGDFISTPEGTLLACNKAYAKILGFDSVEEIIKHNAMSFYPHPQIREDFLSILKEKKKVEGHEIEMQRRDGRPIYIIENVIGSFNNDGELTEIKGYLFDITDRKKLEEQFIQAQKMEAIGRLAGGVAHDFNNILTVINGYSEVLLSKSNMDQSIRSKIEMIKKAGEKAKSLTDQLLSFSRRQTVQPQNLNLNNLIRNTSKMLRRLVGEDIELTLYLSPALSDILIDPGQVDQILMNMVINARDAMPDGGKIIIETASAEVDEQFIHNHIDIQPGHYVQLIITDNGIGMNKEIQAHIFEPFFTTKEAGKGTGLGLATIYGIVKQNNGSITVYSEPEVGTTFKIFFPVIQETNTSGEEDKSDTTELNGNETILLVEDDEALRYLILNILKGYGYQILIASNGLEAINICKESGSSVHLLLTDIIMPMMNGRELADHIRSFQPELKVMYMSGYTGESIHQQGVLESDAPYIQKPFSPTELASKIRRILDDNPLPFSKSAQNQTKEAQAKLTQKR